MRRDLIFFVSGVPEKMAIHDAHFFFAPVQGDIVQELAKIGDEVNIKHWLQKAGKKFHAFALRNDLEHEDDSITDAYQKLSGILDGYAFLTGEITPEIWPIVQVRENNEPHTAIKLMQFKAWARLNSKDGVAEKNWENRTMQLLNRFLLFFDVASSDDPNFNTELANQVLLSAKMFHHGIKAQSYGIEFLCKFSALEGLVCGPRQQGHGKLLRERLSELFRNRNGITAEVQQLWQKRCEASHQGKAFSNDFSVLIEPIDTLVLGTMVFAIDHLAKTKTIDELWNNYPPHYTLPAEAAMERPPEIRRLAAVRLIGNTELAWVNIGLLTDSIFDQLNRNKVT